jgi:hypothetical protein
MKDRHDLERLGVGAVDDDEIGEPGHVSEPDTQGSDLDSL